MGGIILIFTVKKFCVWYCWLFFCDFCENFEGISDHNHARLFFLPNLLLKLWFTTIHHCFNDAMNSSQSKFRSFSNLFCCFTCLMQSSNSNLPKQSNIFFMTTGFVFQHGCLRNEKRLTFYVQTVFSLLQIWSWRQCHKYCTKNYPIKVHVMTMCGVKAHLFFICWKTNVSPNFKGLFHICPNRVEQTSLNTIFKKNSIVGVICCKMSFYEELNSEK